MKQNKPSKMCVACGLEKPLNAYLQITGPTGTSYGEVCATCRGSGLGRKITLPNFEDEREGDPTSSGLKIDAKTKNQIELDKRELAEKIKADERKEKGKKENVQDDMGERKELKHESERKHREEYLETKNKDSFLNYRSKKVDTKHVASSPQEKEDLARKFGADAHIASEDQIKQEGIKVEQAKTTEDFTTQRLDQHTTTISRDNPIYKAWEELMGESGVTKTVRRQLFQTNKNVAQQAAKNMEKKNPAVEFTEKTWEPNSPDSPNKRTRR